MIEKNYSYESVFLYLKSGISSLSASQVEELENYRNVEELVIEGKEKNTEEVLTNADVREKYSSMLRKIAKIYVDANNIIHFMHDKYAYEASQMALHDTKVKRLMAFGIAGYSVAVDSLSAIKHGLVQPVRNKQGIATSFYNYRRFPTYGNDDDTVDEEIGHNLLQHIISLLQKNPTYRNAEHTLSILTITSNVVYGKNTGATPDGRLAWMPFAPGANPMSGRDNRGAIAALNSVAKIDYDLCQDGISNTFSIIPSALGNTEESRIRLLSVLLDGYFASGGHHLNVNVMDKEMLLRACDHPEEYPNLTIRVSGYAVLFNSLTAEQKREVINRTFHGGLL